MKDSHVAAYTDLPYPNKIYPERHINNLHLRARFYGLNPSLPESCRMLDLACSNARQIIAMAHEFPDSEFVGLDSSAAAIEDGQKLVDDLGLRNIDLVCGDFQSLRSFQGSFDYVTVYGAFSWVSATIQRTILQIVHDHLSEHGVFLLHYRSYPGSMSYEALRRLLCLHVEDHEDTQTRLKAAYELIDFLHETLPTQHPLRSEVEEVYEYKGDEVLESLFYHDFVAPDAECFYIEDLVEQARSFKLQYICELLPHYTWNLHLNRRSERVLRRILDPVRREQYFDYLSYNSTRYSLFCHQKLPASKELDENIIRDCMVCARTDSNSDDLDTKNQPGYDMDYFPGSKTLTDCIINAIGEAWPQAISFDELIDKAMNININNSGDLNDLRRETVTAELSSFIRRKYEAGQLQLWPYKYNFCQHVSNSPMTTVLTRALVQHNKPSWVINQRYESVNLDKIQQQVLLLSDGNRSIGEIVQEIQASETYDQEERMDTPVPVHENNVYEILRYFASNAMLIA